MSKLTMRQARRVADLTQEQVANLLGMHPQTYLKYEKECPEKMPIDKAVKFCEIVNLDFDSVDFLH